MGVRTPWAGGRTAAVTVAAFGGALFFVVLTLLWLRPGGPPRITSTHRGAKGGERGPVGYQPSRRGERPLDPTAPTPAGSDRLMKGLTELRVLLASGKHSEIHDLLARIDEILEEDVQGMSETVLSEIQSAAATEDYRAILVLLLGRHRTPRLSAAISGLVGDARDRVVLAALAALRVKPLGEAEAKPDHKARMRFWYFILRSEVVGIVPTTQIERSGLSGVPPSRYLESCSTLPDTIFKAVIDQAKNFALPEHIRSVLLWMYLPAEERYLQDYLGLYEIYQGHRFQYVIVEHLKRIAETSDEAVARMEEMVYKNASVDVRANILSALADVRGSQSEDFLKRIYAHGGHPKLSERALYELIKVNTPGSIEFVSRVALASQDPAVRLFVAESVAELQKRRAVNKIVWSDLQMQNLTDDDLMRLARDGLEDAHVGLKTTLLAKMCADADARVRLAAARALADINPQEARIVIEAMLGNADNEGIAAELRKVVAGLK